MEQYLISLKEVCRLENKSPTQIRREVFAGKHPAPIRNGARKFSFVASEVHEHIQKTIADSPRVTFGYVMGKKQGGYSVEGLYLHSLAIIAIAAVAAIRWLA